ncbi:MAG: OsmC family protein [Pseudomonadales bacterium]|nr:OsmC family protein [Pseudomonadales bacterium]
MRKKVEFQSDGVTLSGALEMPESGVQAYALFAHCFTCGKDTAAASRISRALTRDGIAVLRFDFTGLGNSDGDFANTNFSSNVQDLVAAAEFLAGDFEAPQLLIGHSLGGAAVLAAAASLDSVKAVVTIGAPHAAEHVVHNFGASLDDIRQKGEADVDLAGRTFKIKKQFVDDLESFQLADLGKLRKALLVMHSPLDATVGISEAELIYKAAKHPKSFVSLDDADHLLTKKADSEYAATIIAGWASRYLDYKEQTRPGVDAGKVLVEEKDHKFALHVHSDDHYWQADEPKSVGGNNTGPDPYEHLLASLGACTVMTIRMYAFRKSLPLDDVRVELTHGREYYKDCESCADEEPRKIEVIERQLTLVGDLSDEQRQKLLEIADKCPVHRTLHSELHVNTRLTGN